MKAVAGTLQVPSSKVYLKQDVENIIETCNLIYAVRGFVDGLREQLDFVWAQQWDVVWRNYVHEIFKNRNSTTDKRRRHLALDLGARGDWVQSADIRELTPQLAKAYANKTAKTVQRDLNALHEMGLIIREHRRVRAQREITLSFLPLRSRTIKKHGE